MTTNFKQTGNDLEQYLVTVANKDLVPQQYRKSGGPWGGWGSLWSWGQNTYGVLGLNNISSYSSPVQVGALTDWKQLSSGERHNITIKTDGTLWTWGVNNYYGALGLGTANDYRSSPVQIGSLTNWNLVSAGWYHTAAIKTDGTLWTWGFNNWGQLGLGNTTNISSPVQVGSLTTWKQVGEKGWFHTAAIKTDGTLWAWGRNDSGQLGLGNTTSGSSPVQIGTLTDWQQVSSGAYYAAAIKTDGTLWAWGKNDSGQLGLNDVTHRSSPIQVGSLTNWKMISAGTLYNIAIKTDGTLWAWGSNSYGQLGLGDRTHRSSPVQIGTLTDWNYVDSGSANNIAIKTDGTLWTWGNNTYGQLGLGDTAHRSSPVQVGSLTAWNNVACGSSHTIATKL